MWNPYAPLTIRNLFDLIVLDTEAIKDPDDPERRSIIQMAIIDANANTLFYEHFRPEWLKPGMELKQHRALNYEKSIDSFKKRDYLEINE